MASLASSILTGSGSSQIQKTLAGYVLSQASSSDQAGAEMEGVASAVMQSDKYSDTTKSLAASLLSQSNRCEPSYTF
ncbi:hypothetical protein GAGA_2838 [Paraglaciecola agarilytica NO2]|uniref:Uncharacterized protein n=1 Tax=Paraglaciecola agarilytica NO2 TaxID=1125747 RepID=A0ABQ0I8J6_9ALTE|nr:hypothetical protein GAGA_2838 [Paraglaciecola agarilytica NO2]